MDSYGSISKNGLKTWKVKLQCQRCGAEFEKAVAVDINNVKCKCMVKYPHKYAKTPHIKYKWNDKEYTLKQIADMANFKVSKTKYWINKGISIDDIIKGKVKKQCDICGKEFETGNIQAVCCSTICQHRKNHNKGAKILKSYKCEICGSEFQSYQPNCRFCSDKCRKAAARLERRKRYQNLKKLEKFDISVTLDKVYEKFDGKCCFCNKALYFSENPLDQNYPTIDHIKPISKGGAHEWNNVQLLCHHCNNVKGAKYEE